MSMFYPGGIKMNPHEIAKMQKMLNALKKKAANPRPNRPHQKNPTHYPSSVAQGAAEALSSSDADTPLGVKIVINRYLRSLGGAKPRKRKLTKKQLAALAKGRAKICKKKGKRK